MGSSQFDANTYGIGELITQRKLLEVPPHQRNYSWAIEQIEQFFNDIAYAIKSGAPDYFIGLVVLQGPFDGVWRILDGQQRLTTTTMIYSAIRGWLKDRNFDEDAKQIESEYLGVRQLGGDFSPRLKLNSYNHILFERYVVSSYPISGVRSALSESRKKSSNYWLLEGAIFCRKWISEYAEGFGSDIAIQAQSLFDIAKFLETKLKVVCVDVSTEADAFVLFESLNDRGADLSAFDLIKNYIFSVANKEEFSEFDDLWGDLARLIEGSDADDFLKYFWTSRFGTIQKVSLFRRIQASFKGADGVRDLLNSLIEAAEYLSAMDDISHFLWFSYLDEIKDKVFEINKIGSRQARSVIYSVMKRMSSKEVDRFLSLLVVALVRFQMIGHGRTGVLEKVLGRLSPQVWSGDVDSAAASHEYLSEILSSDEQFYADFCGHREWKDARAGYLLGKIEQHFGGDKDSIDRAKVVCLAPYITYSDEDEVRQVGAYFIVEADRAALINKKLVEGGLTDEVADLLFGSAFATNLAFSLLGRIDYGFISNRTRELAKAACECWSIKAVLE